MASCLGLKDTPQEHFFINFEEENFKVLCTDRRNVAHVEDEHAPVPLRDWTKTMMAAPKITTLLTIAWRTRTQITRKMTTTKTNLNDEIDKTPMSLLKDPPQNCCGRSISDIVRQRCGKV